MKSIYVVNDVPFLKMDKGGLTREINQIGLFIHRDKINFIFPYVNDSLTDEIRIDYYDEEGKSVSICLNYDEFVIVPDDFDIKHNCTILLRGNKIRDENGGNYIPQIPVDIFAEFFQNLFSYIKNRHETYYLIMKWKNPVIRITQKMDMTFDILKEGEEFISWENYFKIKDAIEKRKELDNREEHISSEFKKKGEKHMKGKNKIKDPIEVVQGNELTSDTIITLKDILKAEPCEDELYWFMDYCMNNNVDILNGISFRDVKFILEKENKYQHIKWCMDNLIIETDVPDRKISVKDFVNNIITDGSILRKYIVGQGENEDSYFRIFILTVENKLLFIPIDCSYRWEIRNLEYTFESKDDIARWIRTGNKIYIFDSIEHFVDWKRK